MGLALVDFLEICENEVDKKNFFKLVEDFGMKIPIVAAQRTFAEDEVVYFALPPFLMQRYADRVPFEASMGKATIVGATQEMGLYLVEKGNKLFWLPSFYLHRNAEIAEDMYRKQLKIMIEREKEDGKKAVRRSERPYSVPIELLMGSERQHNEWFYEHYQKPSLSDMKAKTKSLGF